MAGLAVAGSAVGVAAVGVAAVEIAAFRIALVRRGGERLALKMVFAIGIAAPQQLHQALGRLFEKFYRADNAHAVETEGTGLGLYLVRLIIERLAGEVWCESEEGRGSAFIFTLPISG